MARHPQGVRRVVTGAAVAAAVATALVGTGVGVSTAQEPPAPVPSAVRPVPAVPAPGSGAAVRAPERAAAPAPGRADEPVDEPPREPAADGPVPDQPVLDGDAVPDAVVPVDGPAPAPATVPGTPCSVTARACVDLAARTAWLVADGVVRRGPVDVQIGGETDPTPLGTFAVEWKAEAWTSREHLTQMPYSVFFAEGGIAFHEGALDTNSAGCVKLVHADAVAFFEHLQVGDEVQIR